jgi:hypothetical protein
MHRRNQILAGVGVSVVLFCLVLVPTVMILLASFSVMNAEPDIELQTVFLLSFGVFVAGVAVLMALRPWCLSRRWDVAWRTLAWMSPAWLSPALWTIFMSFAAG